MLKDAFYTSHDAAAAPIAIPLFGKADSAFEKTSAPQLVPDVVRYIETLRPTQNSIYVLVNALGAGEYYGANINGDDFPEAALIHTPDNWTGNPLVDAIRAKDWPYGYPTFYNAHAYAHHRNKDKNRAFGDVELAVWNPRMHRVELVVRIDKQRCEQFGAIPVWDKLAQGLYPDVSMGCKVPFDHCSICVDWAAYRRAQATFDPKRHKSPGDAVLAYHRALKANRGHGIRGLSITRADYCEHARKRMNHIFPDGRRVRVFNDYPRFFDISFVFLGADKTAKVMMKIAQGARIWSWPSGTPVTKLGFDASCRQALVVEQMPSAADAAGPLKFAFLGKDAKDKESEIVKDVVPSQFAGKAVPVLQAVEPELPKELLNRLGALPLESSLATTGALGIVLRPREFQRITLTCCGLGPTADDWEERNVVFGPTFDSAPVCMGPEHFRPSLARLLLSLLPTRCAFGPFIERRVLLASPPLVRHRAAASLSSDVLDKIGAAYNGYRSELMNLVASGQDLMTLAALPQDQDLHKFAAMPAAQVFTPLSFAYLANAFWDERGVKEASQAQADVQRGAPSMNTRTTGNLISGDQMT